MNIRDALLEDKNQHRKKALSIAEYGCSSQKNFKELMQCFLARWEICLQQLINSTINQF